MSSTPLGITQFGAFTPNTAALIAQAIAGAGFGTTGRIFYCDPVNGLDTSNGLLAAPSGAAGQGPVKTLGGGYALLRAGFNDVLVLIGNGTSTGSARLSATFTWAKNAAHLFGICAPSAISQRARIAPTLATTAFANFFAVSGSGCLFQNVSWFQGFDTGVAAEICMGITGSRNAFINCDFEGMGDTTGATDAGSRCIKIATGGQENYFGHCNIGLDTVSRTTSNASVEIAGGGPRNMFENCTFVFMAGDATINGLLCSGAASLDRWVLFKNCTFINAVQSTATAMTGLVKLSASVGGMVCIQNSFSAGITSLGADATSKAQMYIYGAAPNTSAFLADQPA